MTRYPRYDVKAGDVPRDLFPTGRVRFSLGATGAEARRRRERLNDLRVWGAWDILRAIQDGRLHVAEVCRRIRQDGERALTELRRDLVAVAVGEPPTLAGEAARYLEWYEARRGETSAATRRSELNRALSMTTAEGIPLGEIRIDRATVGDVEAVVLAVSDRPNTRESIRLAVSALYTWSIREEAERARKEKRAPRWTVNPASKAEKSERTRRVATATEDQVLALIAAAEIYQEAYLRAFLHLGFREAELIHTRRHDDLELPAWTWRIQGRGPDARCPCKQCQGRGWTPKTRRSSRTLYVPEAPAALRGAILRYLEAYPCEPGDFVFRNPRTGRVWHARALADDFAALCARAGVRYGRDVPGGITLHTLRHTCATELIRRGVRESVVAALLGDTVQTIVSTYVHLTPEDLADGVREGPSYDL